MWQPAFHAARALLASATLNAWNLKHYVKEGDVKSLLVSRFPFRLKQRAPRVFGLELTNACNLACTYCDGRQPRVRRPQGFMAEKTFDRVIAQARAMRVQRLRLVGAGEPTLHPAFCRMAKALRRVAPVVSITTNAQHLRPDTVEALAECFHVVEVSVDSDHAAGYESVRRGGSFGRLLENIGRLREASRRKASFVLHIRVMLKPSELCRERELVGFWRKLGDVVTVWPARDFFALGGDLFCPPAPGPMFRRCAVPFKFLGVHWNGDVPLCNGSNYQMPGDLIVGNVADATLEELWASGVLETYREAHRHRNWKAAPVCAGCPYRW
jgi:MoaA/NifB/PqqE/SkfB family radical SAM enzyme